MTSMKSTCSLYGSNFVRILGVFTYRRNANSKLDKNNKLFSTFLDMKSDELRDILRLLLKDVKAVCLREDKPTVSRSFMDAVLF
jgi:hypothetical protein